MWLQIVLSPIAWLMSWLSYLNGTAQLGTALASFGGRQTRGQLDRAALYMPLAWPAVLARGMLAMFEFDESRTLPTISVPTLILVGDKDRATNPDASAHMAANIP